MWNKCSKNIKNGTAVYHLIILGQLYGLYSAKCKYDLTSMISCNINDEKQ